MQRHVLSKKDALALLQKIKDKYNLSINPEKIEIGKEKKSIYYFFDDVLAFFGEDIIPSLCLFYKLNVPVSNFQLVKVDEGAVKAVLKGADLFIPGIKEYSCDCKENDIIIVTTLQDKPIAVMKALISKKSAEESKKGKFAVNLHYLGDEIWQTCK
ncbi:DUF1947 domain-containing protein [Acidianus sulfidivorans JP7]|uniref:RNA-binding protein n=1 Tax=Acidianus sulfidivorans JP7 TaxID=619593 RepID=A0A2U9INC1_9CREN|nr:DUF1947 domain-containing protein [Acidianus sulfidivorans]AWR97510.1 DUF1947 domain-containing protein [Acidianus sulfidivorans JP7]